MEWLQSQEAWIAGLFKGRVHQIYIFRYVVSPNIHQKWLPIKRASSVYMYTSNQMPFTDQITEIASYVRNFFWVTILYHDYHDFGRLFLNVLKLHERINVLWWRNAQYWVTQKLPQIWFKFSSL